MIRTFQKPPLKGQYYRGSEVELEILDIYKKNALKYINQALRHRVDEELQIKVIDDRAVVYGRINGFFFKSHKPIGEMKYEDFEYLYDQNDPDVIIQVSYLSNKFNLPVIKLSIFVPSDI